MMSDNRNTILAVILSGLVLLGWQYFYNIPQMEKQRAAQQAQTQQAPTTTPAQNAGSSATPQASTPSANAPATAQAGSAAPVSRETAIAAGPRVKIESPRLSGSISLKGARIDDLSLLQFRETVDPASPAIVLYSPSGTENPYYAEFGWVAASGSSTKMPDQNTLWQQETPGSLTPSHPVTLKYENGDGLTFRRTIAVDDHYLFTV
jgi:YidC/Oxa1 family membrane protein insertase